MLAPWGNDPIPKAPPGHSDIGDDHSPFEYSVAWCGERSDVRLLVEAQASDWASARRAGLDLGARLGRRGADLRRLSAVSEWLLPDPREVRDPLFLLWYTVSLGSDPLRAKCYLNPNIRGPGEAHPLMAAVFERLGLKAAWCTFDAAQRQLRTRDVFLFSLDLEDTESARVKIYAQPSGAAAGDLERVAELAPRYTPGEVAEFCRAMTGSPGPYEYAPSVTRLPSVYFSFTRDEATPSDLTIQIPIRFYAADDAVARDRVCGYLRSRGLDPASYERALEAVSTRPLREGRGLNAWVSLRTGTSPPLVTVYFAAELYRVLPPLAAGA
jgi:DMATS type aromatic prenyltransferase